MDMEFCFIIVSVKRTKSDLEKYIAIEQQGTQRPRGLMDKASDFGSEDWGFESLRGQAKFFEKFFIDSENDLFFVYWRVENNMRYANQGYI